MNKLNTMSILIVDQDQSFRKGLSHGLYSHIPDIVECDNPGQAKKVLNFQHMNLILTELNFHGSDGLSFIKYCVNKWPKIPVIVISSYANEMKNNLKEFGIQHIIEKPISAQLVLQTIQSIINP